MPTDQSNINNLKASAHWSQVVLSSGTCLARPPIPITCTMIRIAPCSSVITVSQAAKPCRYPLQHLAPGSLFLKNFPTLRGSPLSGCRPEHAAQVPYLLKCQLAVSAHDQAGNLIDVAAIQIPGVWIGLYSLHRPLGCRF